MENDLISRSVLLDHILEKKAETTAKNEMSAGAHLVLAILDLLAELVCAFPTVDAVEVVRCGGCDWSNDSGCAEGFCWCDKWNIGRFDNDYCSEGVRRAEAWTL